MTCFTSEIVYRVHAIFIPTKRFALHLYVVSRVLRNIAGIYCTMKKFIVIFSFVVIVFGCNSKRTPISESAHIGFWSGYDSENALVTLQLNQDGSAKLTTNNNTLDNNFQIDNVPVELRYSIDYSHNPIQLDLIVQEKESGKKYIVWEGIAEFVSEKTLKHCLNFADNDQRFQNIEEAGPKNCVTFEKK